MQSCHKKTCMRTPHRTAAGLACPEERLRPYAAWFLRMVGEGPERGATSDVHLEENVREMHRYKVSHSFRVLRNVSWLTRAEGLDGRLRFLVRLTALLHDTGRFAQVSRHGTFDDLVSENHGRTGARMLWAHDVLSGLRPAERKAVLTGVAYHNRAHVPDRVRGAGRVCLDMVRDADKLDIVCVFPERVRSGLPLGKLLKQGIRDEPGRFRRDMADRLAAGLSLPYSELDTVEEFKLFLLGWVFELNYPSSRRVLRDKRWAQRIMDMLPCSERLVPALERVRATLESA